jgi:hypothetical protein
MDINKLEYNYNKISYINYIFSYNILELYEI